MHRWVIAFGVVTADGRRRLLYRWFRAAPIRLWSQPSGRNRWGLFISSSSSERSQVQRSEDESHAPSGRRATSAGVDHATSAASRDRDDHVVVDGRIVAAVASSASRAGAVRDRTVGVRIADQSTRSLGGGAACPGDGYPHVFGEYRPTRARGRRFAHQVVRRTTKSTRRSQVAFLPGSDEVTSSGTVCRCHEKGGAGKADRLNRAVDEQHFTAGRRGAVTRHVQARETESFGSRNAVRLACVATAMQRDD